jgi:hypothetical protein
MGEGDKGREAMHRDRLRHWVSRNLHPIVFLGTYFLATVTGNLIFASPLADQSLRATGSSAQFLQFTTTFTLGYWMLLLCPFILTPPLVVATRNVFRRPVGWIAKALPEFTRLDYAIIAALCFGFVIYRFWSADVYSLFASGTDFTSSVEARFTIRERLGFVTFVPLQAHLPFLTFYAFIRWMHSRELFWLACTILDFSLLSVLLVMINMKWPVILFYIGLVLAILVYARSRAHLKIAIGAVMTFVAFLMVSSFVFRAAPPPDPKTTPAASPPLHGRKVRRNPTCCRRRTQLPWLKRQAGSSQQPRPRSITRRRSCYGPSTGWRLPIPTTITSSRTRERSAAASGHKRGASHRVVPAS